MADQDKDQRTEKATPKRREKLREEGKVAKSADVGAAAVLLGSVLAMAVFGSHAAGQARQLAERCFRLEDRPLSALLAILPTVQHSLLPILLSSFVAAAVAGVLQTRGLFSWSILAFKPERLNPIPQLKNILPSKTTLVEVAKQLLKVLILGVVVAYLIATSFGDITVLGSTSAEVASRLVAGIITRVFVYGGCAFALLAALDYFVAWRKFEEEAKMSKQDVKDEHHSQEGRPEIKGRRRQKARQLAKRRAVAVVGDATVLVCNPTHVAIALRYEAGVTPAPIVLAKGLEETALQMRAAARSRGVPVMENRPLARTLLATAKVGEPIPAELYGAVAEVIARVLRLK